VAHPRGSGAGKGAREKGRGAKDEGLGAGGVLIGVCIWCVRLGNCYIAWLTRAVNENSMPRNVTEACNNNTHTPHSFLLISPPPFRTLIEGIKIAAKCSPHTGENTFKLYVKLLFMFSNESYIETKILKEQIMQYMHCQIFLEWIIGL